MKWKLDLALLLCTVSVALGQRSHGYAFVAPGDETSIGSYLHEGIGGEWVSRIGVGAGGEIGYVGNRRFSGGFALISGNGSYHFPIANSKFDPFGTLGVSWITNLSGQAALFNYGGGLNYWFSKHLGGRGEFRDHVWNSESRHLVEFRFGISFR